MARMGQCTVYIAGDRAMREGGDGEAARARNSDIVEDLGLGFARLQWTAHR